MTSTKDHSLAYGRNNSTELIGYSDSDWAGDKDDCHSTTRSAFVLVGGLLAWATQKQRTIALLSTEAEYMALTECSKHAKWMLSLLEQLHFDVDLPIDIFSDSLSTRSIASNNVFHKRTKHIDIKYHYVREKINNGTLALNEVNTKANLADILMKALPHDQYSKLAVCLRLIADLFAGECCKNK